QVAQQRGEAIEQILIHRAEKQAIAEQRERRAQAAAQNAQPTQPAGPTTHWLELVDGRRLPGRIGFVPDGQSITWTHALLIQEAAVELEDIAAITFNTRSFTAAPPTVRDRVVFVNGDSLEGFILAIKAEG